jgi:hypothetical protein
MKRLTAASSAIAAATLVSATALMGASGTLAAEPLRLSAAQMDTITAGDGSTSVSISQSTTTIVKGAVARTERTTTIIEDGKKTVKREVIEERLDAKRHRPHVHRPDIPDFQEGIDAIRSRVEARTAELRQRAAEFRARARKR